MSRTALALRLGAAALLGLVAALLFAGYATPAMTLALDALALCF